MFPDEFYVGMQHFCKNFGNLKILKNSRYSKGIILVNLSNSFDLVETLVMWVFVAAEFESILEILLATFLVTQEAFYAQN